LGRIRLRRLASSSEQRLLPFVCQCAGLDELDLPVLAGNEHPVDYTAVEVDMRIQLPRRIAPSPASCGRKGGRGDRPPT